MPPPLVPDQVEGDLMNFQNTEFGDDDAFRVVSDVLNPGVGRSVGSLQPEPEPQPEQQLLGQLNSGPADLEQHITSADEQPAPQMSEQPRSPSAPVADMDIPEGALADDELAAPEDLPGHIVSAKKRGRPSATPAKTPGIAKTPRTAATINGHAAGSRATSGAKRKAEDDGPTEEPTPVKRPRGRPPRSAAATASARLAAKDAKKGKPGRPKGSGRAPKAATNPKRGRPKKGASKKDSSSNSEVVPKGEYEVEEILESVIDADTFEHMYRVKWKGYGLGEATWEPKTNLAHAAALIKDFDAKQRKQTGRPRGVAATNGTAAIKATKAKSKEVKKPGRPVGRPKKSAGRPAAAKPADSKPAKKPAGRPAPRRTGRPRRVIT